jgi:hypothetical protein
MKIMISFLTTNFSELKRFWKKNKSKNPKSRFCGTDKENKMNLGGKIVIVDWEKKEIIREKNIKTPAGFDIWEKKIYLADSSTNISILDLKLNLKKRISNKYFNDLHSLNRIGNKYLLVASTGIDGILMLDMNGNLCWSWFATEHGYNKDPKGRKRVVERNVNHRDKQYPTLKQTTHLNSALYVGKTRYFKDTIYCSLFHQGEIIAISKKTLKFKKVLEGLKHPHSIYLINKKIIISDTENKSVIISDKNLNNVKREKLKNVGWIQDATLLENGNLLISDPDNNRVFEFDTKLKRVKNQIVFNKEWRIYQAKQLK